MSTTNSTQRPAFGGVSWPRQFCLATIAAAWLMGTGDAKADGCFVFHWDKRKDINEPTQKAIILHDKGREDMILQVKYEGPAEEFGWLIPVPGLPEVKKGSMDCFYELSRLTQRRLETGPMMMSAGLSRNGVSEDEDVHVIKIKTVGAYEVAVLSAAKGASLAAWLEAHQFNFPKEKQEVLDDYARKQWYFIAAKIDPNQNGFTLQRGLPKMGSDRTGIAASTRKKLANGELHPLVIRFPSEKCVFPLAISAVNGKSSEVSLYVLSAEPLASRLIFDKKCAAYSKERAEWILQAPEREKAQETREKEADERFKKTMKETRAQREERINRLEEFARKRGRSMRTFDNDPDDPPPNLGTMGTGSFPTRPAEMEDGFDGGLDLVESMEVAPKDLSDCSKALPRLAGKSWWLTKMVQKFEPAEMRDLEFEPAVSLLAGKLGGTAGQAAASCLQQLGGCAIPVVLAGARSSNAVERRWSASAMANMEDARLTEVVPALLRDADAHVRGEACSAAGRNWSDAFTPRLAELLRDSDGWVRGAAWDCLARHPDDSQIPLYRKMVEEDGPPAAQAIHLLRDYHFSREELVHLFSSTNLSVIAFSFGKLRRQDLSLSEIEPLLTNSLVMARIWGLGALTTIGDKRAVDRIVAMLRDPNAAFRWHARAKLRQLTGQKLGPDPAAYEKWWAENKNHYTPPQSAGPGLARP
jgi:hypothetical protein